MIKKKLYEQIIEHFPEVIACTSKLGKRLRKELNALHPADIAYFFELLDEDESRQLFLDLSPTRRLQVFKEFSDPRKVTFLTFLEGGELSRMLMSMPADELVDFFDELSDEELKKYLKLLQKESREKVVSLLKCPEDSIGRHMDIDVWTLNEKFTVKKSIELLQRLQPDQEVHRRIYVTDHEQKLMGYIHLEDLVLHKPELRLVEFLRRPKVVAFPDQDQEVVAKKMVHYNLTSVPVVDKRYHFLGVIASSALLDILGEESRENIYRMATMSPMKHSYFDTPFFKLFYQRSSILVFLLFAQSLSSMIISHYSALLCGFLTYFITMLVSTGGNTSSQTSAIVIQGLASGEINQRNIFRFLRREILMASLMSFLLSGVTFIRVYAAYPGHLLESVAVSISLGAVVMISVTLGSSIPFILRKLNIDPAHSAGPLLATLMDIVGLFTYCLISNFILS